MPWWNPYSGIGLPLAAEAQNSAFFLPFVLLLHFFDGLTYLKITVQIIAGLACFALLRELRLSRATCLIGALCFELNGSYAWFAHGPIMPIAFLPLLLFGIERARRLPWQGAFWVGAAICWSLVAGFPETAYLDGLLGAAWWVLRVASDRAWRPTAAVAAGGLAGLALAAPLLLAFAESLPVSFIGNHADFRGAVFGPANLAQMVFPYLLGAPAYGGLRLGGPPALSQFIIWYRSGGYLQLGLLPLALAAVVVARRDGLRWMLAGWLILAEGRAAGLPGISALVDRVPLVPNTMFPHYVQPACELAVVVLASLALEDWRRGRLARLWPCAIAVLLLAGLSLPGARLAMAQLRAIPDYPWYPVLSVIGGVATVLAVAALASRDRTRRRAIALACVLVAEAAVLFGLPLLAGTPQPRSLNRPAVSFLTRQPPATRVVSVAAMGPNYGAWFGIAAIDHNYLPVPQNWVDDVRATLLPHMDGINNYSSATDPAALAALRARLPALEDHGVGLLLVPPGVDPFTPMLSLPHRDTGNAAFRLAHGAVLEGTLPAVLVQQGQADSLTVQLGTYGRTARGTLTIEICQDARCATGTASFDGAADNADLPVRLATPLFLQAGQAVRYRIAADGPAPAAVWLWPSATGPVPRLALFYATPPGTPPLVYRDATMAVFKLNPAPYFEAQGCRLDIISRTAVRADCTAPSTLLRRELAYPGWRAARNGTQVAVTAAGVFQSVPLPRGISDWRFTYAPPYVGWAWGASAAGIIALIGFALAGLSSGRRAMIGRSTSRLIA